MRKKTNKYDMRSEGKKIWEERVSEVEYVVVKKKKGRNKRSVWGQKEMKKWRWRKQTSYYERHFDVSLETKRKWRENEKNERVERRSERVW